MSSKNRAGKHRLHATCTERGSGTSVPLSVAGSISSRDFSNMVSCLLQSWRTANYASSIGKIKFTHAVTVHLQTVA